MSDYQHFEIVINGKFAQWGDDPDDNDLWDDIVPILNHFGRTANPGDELVVRCKPKRYEVPHEPE